MRHPHPFQSVTGLCIGAALCTAFPAQAAPGPTASALHGKARSAGGIKLTIKTPVAPVAIDLSVTITLHALSDVAGATIKLGDIADIVCADKAFLAQISAVQIGVSPLPGLSRSIMPGDVTVHLRANHLDSRQIELIAPPAIRVTRKGTDVGGDEITAAALAAVLPAIKDQPDVTLEPIQTQQRLTVATGKVKIIAGAYRGDLASGTIYVPVSLYVDGKVNLTTDVTLHVRRKAKVVIARRQIEPREVLTADDVQLIAINLPDGFSLPILDVSLAVGKRATRRILAEAPISSGALETPPAVTGNDKVTIEYVFGSIHISAPGLARQSGAIGDVIRVYATDTRKELEATIVDTRTVRIADSDEASSN